MVSGSSVTCLTACALIRLLPLPGIMSFNATRQNNQRLIRPLMSGPLLQTVLVPKATSLGYPQGACHRNVNETEKESGKEAGRNKQKKRRRIMTITRRENKRRGPRPYEHREPLRYGRYRAKKKTVKAPRGSPHECSWKAPGERKRLRQSKAKKDKPLKTARVEGQGSPSCGGHIRSGSRLTSRPKPSYNPAVRHRQASHRVTPVR